MEQIGASDSRGSSFCLLRLSPYYALAVHGRLREHDSARSAMVCWPLRARTGSAMTGRLGTSDERLGRSIHSDSTGTAAVVTVSTVGCHGHTGSVTNRTGAGRGPAAPGRGYGPGPGGGVAEAEAEALPNWQVYCQPSKSVTTAAAAARRDHHKA
jgi:hypothetical protein